jgi:hypothetical protein
MSKPATVYIGITPAEATIIVRALEHYRQKTTEVKDFIKDAHNIPQYYETTEVAEHQIKLCNNVINTVVATTPINNALLIPAL